MCPQGDLEAALQQARGRRESATQTRSARDRAADRQPGFAIVIPVYKHPVLVGEAIASALHEARMSDGVVVVVNDGCPFPETHEVCLSFSLGNPGLVEYIRTPNGGLSAARNRGVVHALGSFPSVECVYFLDADNRLGAGAIRRSRSAMMQTGADWVYPSIDKFGVEWSGDYTAPYNRFRHLCENICEAGSLVHRRIFDAGLRFDEAMRDGYEDWDFWLQCVGAGFRGAPCSDFGFHYRARRESMLRNSDRVGASIRAYMERKHKRLWSAQNMLRLEHEEAPRYCIVDTERGAYAVASAPGEPHSGGQAFDLDQIFWQTHAFPSHFHFPEFLVAGHGRVLEELRRIGLLDWVFWQIEDALERCSFVYVSLAVDATSLSVMLDENSGAAAAFDMAPHIVATTRACLRDCALDPSTAWVDTLRSGHPEPKVGVLTIAGPFNRAVVERFGAREAFHAVFGLLSQLRSSPFRQADAPRWEWRIGEGLTPTSGLFRRTRTQLAALAPLAAGAVSGKREVAIILPVVSFGGVEQVGIQLARVFREAGWATRLVVTGGNDIPDVGRLRDVFDRICFLNDAEHADWRPSGMAYFGQDLQEWARTGRQDRLQGLLAGITAAVTLQAMHANEITGWLRSHGVVTVTSQHLIDRDWLGAPQGHPYSMMAYEHAYDLIAAPSHRLLSHMAALGVPQQKLLHLENAPTFDADAPLRARRMHRLARAGAADAQPAERQLRVLYIGRLDRQKGAERLAAAVAATRAQELAIAWRVVGAGVVPREGVGGIGPELVGLGVRLEEPVYERAAVIERLLWADAIVLLSRWEGSPLILLEAQSLGVVPIATSVGAVAELIDSGEDGFLIEHGPSDEIVRDTVDRLAELCRDPELRARIARAAIARSERLNWQRSAAPLLRRVEEIASARGL